MSTKQPDTMTVRELIDTVGTQAREIDSLRELISITRTRWSEQGKDCIDEQDHKLRDLQAQLHNMTLAANAWKASNKNLEETHAREASSARILTDNLRADLRCSEINKKALLTALKHANKLQSDAADYKAGYTMLLANSEKRERVIATLRNENDRLKALFDYVDAKGVLTDTRSTVMGTDSSNSETSQPDNQEAQATDPDAGVTSDTVAPDVRALAHVIENFFIRNDIYIGVADDRATMHRLT